MCGRLGWTSLAIAGAMLVAATGASAATRSCPTTTEVLSPVSYRVSRCDSAGRLVTSMTVGLVNTPGARSGAIPLSTTTATAGGGWKTTAYEYADFATDPQARAGWNGAEGDALRAAALPAAPGTVIGPADAVDRSIGACADSRYALWPGHWSRGRYAYRTRNATFPNGNTTRAAITRGHHNWDNTDNDCGFSDTTPLASDWAGTTSTGYHTVSDGVSVIDFGDMSNVGASDSANVGVTTVWTNAANLYVETDQRYNAAKSWTTAGAAGAYDVENIATHETGHSIGIEGDYRSSSHSELTMYSVASWRETKKRTLGRGDVLAMRAKY